VFQKAKPLPDLKGKYSKEKTRLRFKEIKCPLTHTELLVKNCSSCSYCKEMPERRIFNRTLSTFICQYNSQGGLGEQ